ncbi:hypothetical protein LCGC14_0657430 [marine sediment metagenome]|uniref:Acylneuraminate cytidylyltransferase family protein n=1 Tax=marine sediment metagenome TaxID=412755 RepID=A0A0F9QUM3_9ZZZZ
MQIHYLIPARAGSTRFPNKNRLLVPFAMELLLPNTRMREDVTLSTDDTRLIDEYRSTVRVIERPEHLCQPKTSMKATAIHAADLLDLPPTCLLVILYPTYPCRTWQDICDCVEFFVNQRAKSVLCAEPLLDHPILAFEWLADHRGQPVITSTVYRGQDQLDCFRLCHYVVIIRVDELTRVNNQLYNAETHFFRLKKRPLDVDHMRDIHELRNRL